MKTGVKTKRGYLEHDLIKIYEVELPEVEPKIPEKVYKKQVKARRDTKLELKQLATDATEKITKPREKKRVSKAKRVLDL